MTSKEIKELNDHPMDWCYNCAKIACKTPKQKMFAWIVCFLMKSDNAYYYFIHSETAGKETFQFGLNLGFVLNENEAIADELHKKKNWRFLTELIYNHIMNCDVQITKERCKALLKPKIEIVDEIVKLKYNC